MKRFISLLIVAVLVVACMGTAAFAAGTPAVAGTTEYTTAGGTVTVKVSLTDKVTFASCGLTISYDDALTLKDVQLGAATKDKGALTWNNKVTNNNKLNIVGTEDFTVAAGGQILLLKFKVADDAAPGTYNVSIKVRGFNAADLSSVTVNSGNGAVVVEKPACDHNYEGKITTPATCDKDGVKTYTCTKCGDSYTEVIKATGHKWDEGKVTTKPTCAKAGVKTYTCTKCGETKTESIPATGEHEYEGKVTTPATCEKDGVKTYTCKVCGDSYTEVIKATGHKWDEGKVTTKPTCAKAGVKTYTCTKCGETKTESIPATGEHEYEGKVTTPATCEKDGVKTYTCKVCGDSYTEVIKATGHDYEGKITTQPTCGQEGVKTFTCKNCGHTYTEDLPATGNHDYKEEVTPATCTEDGVKTYTCKVCGDSYTETITATGHAWDNGVVTKEATCGEDGVITYTCKNCGETKTEVIPSATVDHTFQTVWAYDEETHWHECAVCGAKADEEEHIIGEHIVKMPTATEKGLKQFLCETCGYVDHEEILDEDPDLDDIVQTGDITDQIVFGGVAFLLAICAAAWVVLKRKAVK